MVFLLNKKQEQILTMGKGREGKISINECKAINMNWAEIPKFDEFIDQSWKGR